MELAGNMEANATLVKEPAKQTKRTDGRFPVPSMNVPIATGGGHQQVREDMEPEDIRHNARNAKETELIPLENMGRTDISAKIKNFK